MADESVGLNVYRLSNKVFGLAQQAAGAGGAERDEIERQAREFNSQLDALWTQLEATPSSDPGVGRAWSDARLEVGWILSKGELAPSPRLAGFLASRSV